MPGGLIQIVAYGAQDLYLTGIPEITFFKYIYKRYTNFATEFIELNFDGEKNFGQDISCNIPKDGDLINQMILKITLPEVTLPKNTNNSSTISDNLEDMNEKETIYLNFNNFIKYIYESIKIAENGIANINENFYTINSNINTYLDSVPDFLIRKNYVDTTINTSFDIVSHLNSINTLLINEYEKKNKLKQLIDSYTTLSISFSKNLYDQYLESKKIYDNSLNNNYNFSWIEDLPWNIISESQLEIGGNVIDRQYSQWLNIWHHLFETNCKKLDINKLHSKSSISYIYDNRTKPSFEIFIPLKFFFCRFIGLSLPLVSIRYQSVMLQIKIQSLKKLIKTNYTTTNIESLISIKDIKLLTSYIFLDQDERSKFAESRHEYLIEQVSFQRYLFNKSDEINVDLQLSNPVKYYAFNLQNKQFIESNNTFSSYGVQTLNGSTLTNSGATITESNLELNGIERLKFMDEKFYNLVTPYEFLKNSSVDGLYFYSFSLNPSDIQPSGSCNFSRLDRKRLNIKLSDSFLNTINNTDLIIVNFVSVNYNILKFSNGLCSLTFNF